MRRFDYSFLNNDLLPAKMINLTSDIASLKTMDSVSQRGVYAGFYGTWSHSKSTVYQKF